MAAVPWGFFRSQPRRGRLKPDGRRYLPADPDLRTLIGLCSWEPGWTSGRSERCWHRPVRASLTGGTVEPPGPDAVDDGLVDKDRVTHAKRARADAVQVQRPAGMRKAHP